MALRLHNTLSGKKEPFTPREPEHARIYVCGPTVYDYALDLGTLVSNLKPEAEDVIIEL